MSQSERLRAVVKGEVQGVGFRWAVQSQDRLDQLEAFLHQGPRWAEVASLDSQRFPATGEFHRFEAR